MARTVRPDPLSASFAALAHPARRIMIERLARGDATISELARPLGIALPAMSRHIDTLVEAGFVERKTVGRSQRCRLKRAALKRDAAWFHRQLDAWDTRLDRLAGHLAKQRR
jgi:DNA-binding transcriptional ArsR family regulator